jgi:hypothetical protein
MLLHFSTSEPHNISSNTSTSINLQTHTCDELCFITPQVRASVGDILRCRAASERDSGNERLLIFLLAEEQIGPEVVSVEE